MSITITPLNSGMCTSNPKTYHYHPSTHKYYANVSNEDKPARVLLPAEYRRRADPD